MEALLNSRMVSIKIIVILGLNSLLKFQSKKLSNYISLVGGFTKTVYLQLNPHITQKQVKELLRIKFVSRVPNLKKRKESLLLNLKANFPNIFRSIDQ